MDRAFKAVEGHRFAVCGILKRFVVVVAADIADCHVLLHVDSSCDAGRVFTVI